MDNPGSSWGPKPSLLGVGAALTVCAAAATVWFATTADPQSALLIGVFAVASAMATGYGALVRPRLRADADGVRVRTLTGTDFAPWPAVHARLVTTRRLGRDGTTLELEFDDVSEEPRLIVLGWLDLGADPDDVLDDLNRLRR
ncbi:PH domain-containing protein [Haloechinothrix salitolerans]|uniref:PH domain-containing protein n=1 Tax=Haloechinothrix salitolerans TaxID=926830 RepID=A0ABW2BS82_9PSEU